MVAFLAGEPAPEERAAQNRAEFAEDAAALLASYDGLTGLSVDVMRGLLAQALDAVGFRREREDRLADLADAASR